MEPSGNLKQVTIASLGADDCKVVFPALPLDLIDAGHVGLVVGSKAQGTFWPRRRDGSQTVLLWFAARRRL
jgi:hypothetical protein